VVKLAKQFLGILVSQIEIEKIFSMVGIFIAFRRCQLQTDNLDKLFFVHKNWPSNIHVGCLKPFELTISFEVEFDLTNELDAKFVDEVEHEEYANWDFVVVRSLPYL